MIEMSAVVTGTEESKMEDESGVEGDIFDVIYMHALPIKIIMPEGEPVKDPEVLNFADEKRQIKDKMREANLQFVFKEETASLKTLESTLNKRPSVLHIACHGESPFDSDKNPKQADNIPLKYLLFEKGVGSH
jgi:hypothetical protein